MSKLKERMAGLLSSLPKEVVFNLPQVVLTGRSEVSIENYQSLIEYTGAQIRINTKNGILKIEGSSLTLKQITTESITVLGDIVKLEFLL